MNNKKKDDAMQDIKKENETIPPTGGWKQYNTAVRVLVVFPMVILLCALLGFFAMPRFHSTFHEEVVRPGSYEPFQFSPSVLPSLHTQDTAGQYPPRQNE